MTGDLMEVGENNGLYHSINVPLIEGCDDENYNYIFSKILDRTIEIF